ncbi:hypothetical protein FJZ53_01360 [Candidatus Woesearchaeota archaeon]|nr:hypothetical protein [Candidatus Woesearchaeota archaeon]
MATDNIIGDTIIKIMNLEEIPDAEKQKYTKIFKSFPDIKDDDIALTYASYVPYAKLRTYEADGKIIKTVIVLGLFFYELFDDEEREAVVAHELGHYIHRKNRSISEAKELSDKFYELESYYKRRDSEEKVVITYTDEEKHRIKELQDIHNAYEFYADDKAIKSGYGEQILSSLEKIAEKHYNRLSRMSKESVKARIERLKQMNNRGF